MRWPFDPADYRWAVVEVFAGSRLLAVAPPPRCDRSRPVSFGENRRSLRAMHAASLHPSPIYAADVTELRSADAVVLGIGVRFEGRAIVASLGLRAYRAQSLAGAVEGLLASEVVA
jgi:hypothetical protein